MDTRRMILWMIFSLSLIMLWDNWQKSQGNPTLFGFATGAKPVAGATPMPGLGHTDDKSVPAADIPQASTTATAAVPDAPAAAPAGQKVTVKTDVLALTFDTVGAQITDSLLFKQPDADDPSKPVSLFESGKSRTYLAQTGLVGLPDVPNHRTAFVMVPGPTELKQGQDTLQVTFEATAGNVKLAETYSFKRGDYKIGVAHTITNLSDTPIAPSVYLQLTRDGSKAPGTSRFYSTFTGPAVFSSETKYKKVAFSDIDKGSVDYAKTSNDGWIAMVQHYFVSAFIPAQGIQHEFYTRKVAQDLYSVGTLAKVSAIAPGKSGVYSSTLFTGPQAQRDLESVAPGLELVRDYGWLTVIAKPLFWLLEHLHSLVSNWGWAIVLLTVIVKLAFFPLSAASYKSMAKMRLLTPRLTKLREQYGDDKMKLNQAMMELYKTEKINPLGGCLPVVVQIPVFISLYWVLLASVEMRNAPWLGWIHDLAVPDPFYILPVVMAATMLVQTRLNPTPPDPLQAKIMMVMPLAFSFMFLFFPSGLVLYWVVNNILSITQQWYITRMFDGGKKA